MAAPLTTTSSPNGHDETGAYELGEQMPWMQLFEFVSLIQANVCGESKHNYKEMSSYFARITGGSFSCSDAWKARAS